MWPVSASTSYLFRDPDGTSTKTSTSAMTRTYRVRPCCDREAGAFRGARRRRGSSRGFGSRRILLGGLEASDSLDEQVEEGVAVEVDADVGVRGAVGALPEIDHR